MNRKTVLWIPQENTATYLKSENFKRHSRQERKREAKNVWNIYKTLDKRNKCLEKYKLLLTDTH